MIKQLTLALCLITPSITLAAPNISGQPDDIKQFLSGIPKEITITGSADQVVTSKEARISLMVKTEAKKLSSALKENYDVRVSLREQLIDLGVKASSINESKFSSTPAYGMFGDEPKSYSVNNVVSVLLSSEQQMIAIASIADNNASIRYLSTKPMLLDKEAVQKALMSKAMSSAKAKAAIYQSEFNVTLVPVKIMESVSGMGQQHLPNLESKRRLVSSYASDKPTSFGSQTLSAAVTIEYKLLPN